MTNDGLLNTHTNAQLEHTRRVLGLSLCSLASASPAASPSPATARRVFCASCRPHSLRVGCATICREHRQQRPQLKKEKGQGCKALSSYYDSLPHRLLSGTNNCLDTAACCAGLGYFNQTSNALCAKEIAFFMLDLESFFHFLASVSVAKRFHFQCIEECEERFCFMYFPDTIALFRNSN